MTADAILREDRVFQIWEYSVGMRRLLLRSTKGDTFDSRIDVLFQNVKALKLPTSLHGLAVEQASPVDAEKIARDTGLLPDGDSIMFIVRGHGYEGYVVAGVCVEREDDGEYFETSPLWEGL